MALLLTTIFRAIGLPAGGDETDPADYTADADDPGVKELPELVTE